MAGARILVVDDEASLLKLLQRALSGKGHTVTCCASGGEALALLKGADTPFDIAIIDLGLPDTYDEELAAAVLEQAPHMKLIVASGRPFDISILNAGSRAVFLMKPYYLDHVNSLVVKLLDR